MKKLVALIAMLVVSLICFTACNTNPAGKAENFERAQAYLQTSLYSNAVESTPADYEVVRNVRINGHAFPITWEVEILTEGVEEDVVKIVKGTSAYTVDVIDETTVRIKYLLKATISLGEKTFTHTFERVIPQSVPARKPVAGTAYNLSMVQYGNRKALYFNGQTESPTTTYRLAMSESVADAVEVYVENHASVEGAFYIYFNDASGTKTYIETYEREAGKGSLQLVTETPANYYVWNDVVNLPIYTNAESSNSFYLGTYSTYTTISVSSTSYIMDDKGNAKNLDVTQFPARFFEVGTDLSGLLYCEHEWVEADCTTPKTCKLCKQTEGEALGHSYKDGVCEECGEEDPSMSDTPVGDGSEANPYTATQAAAIGAAKDHNTYTEDKYYVKGTITEVYNAEYGNMYITDGKTTFTLYGTYDADGENRYDAMATKPVAGDVVVVYGILGQYNGTAQMKNGWIVAINPEEGGDEPVVTEWGVIEAPVAGTAYKFGMVQENVNATDVYYLAGGMSGFYMATTTDKAAAIDVYLEETTGGYHLYAMVSGAKTYINMVVSGTHVNGAYEATASTVYAYNADSKTVIAVVNEADYWFGTRNDNTYTTVGPCAVSYAGFYCQFYGEVAGEGGDAPVVGEEKSVELTVDSLGIPSQSYQAGTATVNGVSFEFIQIGNYGDGIQMRDKNGNTSSLWNTSAFGVGITKIELVYSSTQDVTYSNPDAVIYRFGNAVDNYTYTTKLSTTAGVKTYTITPDVATYTFFQLEHDLGYTMYWDSITVYYNTAAGSDTPAVCEHEGGTATCEAKAVCTKCGEAYGELGDHAWNVTIEKQPTCVEAGKVIKTCGVCGETETVTEIDPNGHTPKVDAAVAPTCTTTGLTEGSHCDVCGAVIVAQEVVDVIAHAWDAGVATAPTCEEDGYTTYTCTTCPAEAPATNKVVDEGTATGHDWVKPSLTKVPTCTANGEVTYTCANGCGETDVLVLEMLPHTDVDPEDGMCEVCGNCAHKTVDEAVKENIVAPDCTEDGSYDSVVYCSVCDAELSRETIIVDALGHDYQNATCLNNGVCEECGAIDFSGDYVLGLYQAKLGKTLYFTGAMDGYYFATTESVNSAAIINIESVSDGYNLTFTASGTKKYIYVEVGSYTNLKFGSTKGLFVWNEEIGIFTTKVSNTDYYMGTYNNFNTISPSKTSYITGSNAANIGVSQFVARLIKVEDHVWNDATCTAPKTCAACGFVEGAALGHTGGTATCTAKAVCDVCEKEYGSLADHDYVEGVCSVCGEEKNVVEQASWTKASSIAVGDIVTLVCESAKKEISGISTTSTKYGLGAEYTSVSGVYQLTVVAGSEAGTYAFKTSDGKYLYWSSGNSLNVTTTLNVNASWKVTFESNGDVTILNAKDNTRKLQWNTSSPRFACYGNSGQTPIQMYVYA